MTLVLALSVLLSCGKKINEQPSPVSQETPTYQDRLNQELDSQVVECRGVGTDCFDGLTKIVIQDKTQLRYCTGFLMNSQTVVTTSSCLGESLKFEGNRDKCRQDVYFFFGRSQLLEPIRRRCQEIRSYSEITGNEPALWSKDIAYILLDQPVFNRRIPRHTRRILNDNESVHVWKIDSKSPEIGIVEKQTCRVIYNSIMNPLSTDGRSPSYVLSGCDFKEGNRGGLVTNDDFEFLGLVSAPMNSDLRRSILNHPLVTEIPDPLIHVSNAFCLPALVASNTLPTFGCNKVLSISSLDEARSQLFEPSFPGGDFQLKIKKSFEKLGSPLTWRIQTRKNKEGLFTTIARPDCFDPNRLVLSWNPFQRTVKMLVEGIEIAFRIYIDKSLRVRRELISEQTVRLEIQYSRQTLREIGSSEVIVKDLDADQQTIYDQVPYCQDSLNPQRQSGEN
jgi:hypothetical protein